MRARCAPQRTRRPRGYTAAMPIWNVSFTMRPRRRRRGAIPQRLLPALVIVVCGGAAAPAAPRAVAAVPAPPPVAAPAVRFHLTARPWKPLDLPASAYLDEVERVARAVAPLQNAEGKVIDPYAKQEIQYSTPYFAYAVGTLLSAGRGADLLSQGVAAMDSATEQMSCGVTAIPNKAGEFYLPPLAEGLALYGPHVPAETMQRWRGRLARPVKEIIRGDKHNWRAYGMKGEWLRSEAGLVDPATAQEFIERSWTETQVARLTDNPLNLYRDETSDPDTLAVEPVGRGNLLALLAHGYAGPSRQKMLDLLTAGTRNSLYLQDPTGQLPNSGRTSNHVWGDAAAALIFETMAHRAAAENDAGWAGRYRRAASLALHNTRRWRRDDGSYFITKNRFDPTDRVGYQPASYFTNYNGAFMYHLAESYRLRAAGNGGDAAHPITEQPAPAEVGGYAFQTSPAFAAAFANAGGMQMQAALRGSTVVTKKRYWTTLGVTRFSRAGWDSRLGPGDGARDPESGLGVSFAPAFRRDGAWHCLASLPDHYQGEFSTQFAHPLLVRCAIDYKPAGGYDGPSFRNEFVLTPDGVLSTLTSTADPADFAIIWPLLIHDGGGALESEISSYVASTGFPGADDRQTFIALHEAPSVEKSEATLRGSYGDLLAVRVVADTETNRTFIYPRGAGDPAAEAVRKSFRMTGTGFSTVLGRVTGDVYVGRTSAGGVGTDFDFDGDGNAEVTLSERCAVVMQRDPADGAVTTIEADRDVTAEINGRRIPLKAFTPAAAPVGKP